MSVNLYLLIIEMSIIFNQDTSTQLPQTSFTSGTPDYNNVNEWSKIDRRS